MKIRVFLGLFLLICPSLLSVCYGADLGPKELQNTFKEIMDLTFSKLEGVGLLFSDKTGVDPTFGGGLANHLFWSLATLSLAWTAIEMALKRAEFGEIVSELTKFVLFTGFFYWLALHGEEFAHDIVDSFEYVASKGAGYPIDNSSAGSLVGLIWGHGNTAFDAILSSMSWDNSGLFGFFPEKEQIFANAIMLIVGLAMFILYVLIAIRILIVKLSVLIQLFAGVFLLGFGGGKWTRETSIQYFKSIISTSSQYLVLMLIIAAVMKIDVQGGMNDMYRDAMNNKPEFKMIIMLSSFMLVYPVILMFISFAVPARIAQLFSSNFTSMGTASPQQVGSMISKGYGQGKTFAQSGAKGAISVGSAATSGIEKASQFAGRKYESARNSKSSKGTDNSQNSANSQNTENISSMNSSTGGGNSPAGTNTENSGNPTAGTGNTENSGNQSQSGNDSNSSNPSSGSGGSGATPSAKGSSSTSSNASPSDSSSSGTSASSGSSAGSTSDKSSTGTTSSEAGSSTSSDSQSANSTASSQQPQGFAATAKMYATKAAAGAATVAKAGARAGKAVADVASATSFIPAVSAGIGTVLGGPAGGVVGLAVGGSIQTALGNKGVQAGAFARNQTIKAVGASMKAIGTGLGNVTHCHPIKAFNAGREQYHRQQEANINTNNSNTTGGNSR
ncbi:MAG: type IV secretion system protein [Succinivibrionaceae bacterium]|nr:type IV secretion system protein [Succinivibrionaceae bacterium]